MKDLTLEVTLTSGCPMMCSYCPQNSYIESYKEISSDKLLNEKTYKIILDNISNSRKKINFTGFTEPLSSPNWRKIAKMTIDRGHILQINTTLYGASKEDINFLASLGCNYRIHLTDSSKLIPMENYLLLYELSKKDLKFDFFSEKGKLIAKELYKYFKASSIDSKALFNKQFAHSRGGNIETIPIRKFHQGPVFCNRKFGQYQNVILPNGDVSVCCSDFSLKYIIGSLITKTIEEIHSSDKMKLFNAKMRQESNDFICKKCAYAKPAKINPSQLR